MTEHLLQRWHENNMQVLHFLFFLFSNSRSSLNSSVIYGFIYIFILKGAPLVWPACAYPQGLCRKVHPLKKKKKSRHALKFSFDKSYFIQVECLEKQNKIKTRQCLRLVAVCEHGACRHKSFQVVVLPLTWPDVISSATTTRLPLQLDLWRKNCSQLALRQMSPWLQCPLRWSSRVQCLSTGPAGALGNDRRWRMFLLTAFFHVISTLSVLSMSTLRRLLSYQTMLSEIFFSVVEGFNTTSYLSGKWPPYGFSAMEAAPLCC